MPNETKTTKPRKPRNNLIALCRILDDCDEAERQRLLRALAEAYGAEK